MSSLTLVYALLSLVLLRLSPVFQVSEGREGVVVREILRSGEYILPLRDGGTVPSKPILFHWMGTVVANIVGEYDEFGLRLPSLLAAVLLLAVVGVAAERTAGTGALSVLLLMSSYGFVRLSMDGRVDMLFCFLMTAAILRWLVAAVRAPTAHSVPSTVYLQTAVFSGFAVLAKGPLGLVLPLTVILLISLLYWRIEGIRSTFRPQWIWAFAVGVPWYVLATMHGKDAFVSRQIVFENVHRFFGGEGITPKPWWFYLVHIWTQASPWLPILTVILCWNAFRKGKRTIASRDSESRKLFWGVLVWFCVLLAFFSVSVGKRRGYLLPVLPPLAILGALVSTQLLQDVWPKLSRLLPVVLRSCSLISLLLILLLFLPLEAIGFARPVTNYLTGLTLVGEEFGLRLLLTLSVCWLIAELSLKTIQCRPIALAILVLLPLQLFVGVLIAAKGHTHTYRAFGELISTTLPAGKELTIIKRKRDESLDGLLFYIKRPHRRIEPSITSLDNGVYLARRVWLERLLSASPELEFSVLSIGRRMVDSVDEELIFFEIPSR